MKTKLKICGVILIVFVVSLIRSSYLKETNDVLLLNIEALAVGVDSDSRCFFIGTVNCPFTGNKVFKVI